MAIVHGRGMPIRALITGITGSGASYLAEFLSKDERYHVAGISRWRGTSSASNIAHITPAPEIFECDLLDPFRVKEIVEWYNPQVVFHMAAYANVRASFQTPMTVMDNNVRGTQHLLEACRTQREMPLFVMCSSSEVYGDVKEKDLPITEDQPFRPVSPYAVSKAAQDLLGYQYFAAYDLPMITTRMFAYINPRRPDIFTSAFARQIAQIEVGLQPPVLKHGNLDSTRVFLDVEDAMGAYIMAARSGVSGEAYNIGGSEVMRVGDVLDILVKRATVPITTEVNPDLVRPVDVTLQIPCMEKFEGILGGQWKPHVTFEDSISRLMSYWRARVRQETVTG